MPVSFIYARLVTKDEHLGREVPDIVQIHLSGGFISALFDNLELLFGPVGGGEVTAEASNGDFDVMGGEKEVLYLVEVNVGFVNYVVKNFL